MGVAIEHYCFGLIILYCLRYAAAIGTVQSLRMAASLDSVECVHF